MAEYIEREAALHAILGEPTESHYPSWYAERIKALPAADVAPAAHGRWIEKTVPEGCRYFECSNCGAHENRHTAIKGYYCWRCGAKMDGGAYNAAD